MQRAVSRNTESEMPTRVLLVGNEWDLLKPALKALGGQGEIVFIELAGHSFHQITSRTALSAIVIGPNFENVRDVLALKGQVDKPPVSPPILQCVTHEALENDDLHEDVDDFLVVPCSTAELHTRIKRLALPYQNAQPSTQLRVGKIVLDFDTYQVSVEGRRVDLAWMEFQLLKFLMENPGKVFTREQLLALVWGVNNFGGTRTVDVHIRRLRYKLSAHGEELFRTVKNVGYGLVDSR